MVTGLSPIPVAVSLATLITRRQLRVVQSSSRATVAFTIIKYWRPSRMTMIGTVSAPRPTLATTVWPMGAGNTALRAIALAVLGSIFVAICAQITVPLWPVPITGQTFAVLVVGMAYGMRLGAASLLLYLIFGVVDLPVFANQASGFDVLMGPSGGYIIGFVIAAGALGYLAERGWDRHPATTALAMIIGNVVLYIPGLLWLWKFYAGPGMDYVASAGAETALGAAIMAGLIPFLIGDVLKLLLAAAVLPIAWRAILKLKS